jgi:hypothetical protein
MHIRTHSFVPAGTWTHPKKEIMASAIQHTIPTYGIGVSAASSPEMNNVAA